MSYSEPRVNSTIPTDMEPRPIQHENTAGPLGRLVPGCYVSSLRGPLLPLEEGQQRRRPSRIYGKLLSSTGPGKFMVRWADGTVAEATRGQLRTEKAPTIPIPGGQVTLPLPRPHVSGVTGPSAARPSSLVS